MWVSRAKNGKIEILLGTAAAREKRRVGRRIDGLIGKALQGKLRESDAEDVASLALLADRLARTGS
jgi:hypothetical protein